MKLKAVLLAAIFVSVTAPAVAAEESGAGKPVTSHSEEKTGAPPGEPKLDFKELFGCEPMGEDGHKPMSKPASGASQQETMQPAQERGTDRH